MKEYPQGTFDRNYPKSAERDSSRYQKQESSEGYSQRDLDIDAWTVVEISPRSEYSGKENQLGDWDGRSMSESSKSPSRRRRH